jgi:parallel beta-helix repeat protein
MTSRLSRSLSLPGSRLLTRTNRARSPGGSHRISRSFGLAVSIGLLGSAILGACSSADDPSAPTSSTSPSSSETATPSPDVTEVASAARSTIDCPTGTVSVSTAEELETSLKKAKAGDVITLEPGTYEGSFVATTSGTADDPISLCGTVASVLDGGGTSKDYVFHLDGASYWNLVGFSVTNGQKGVVADGTVGSTIDGLTVSKIGDEGIHLRDNSTDNHVTGNSVSNTGLRKAKFGEGIYIGTAESNWCDVSDCEPDASDRNTIESNTISKTTAESIDIKEGTSSGVVKDNTFDGSTIDGADSWVDVKGSSWLIEGNTGTNSPMDGFQTHEIESGWGDNNVFRGNIAKVNGPGFGYSLTPELNNVVECDNTASEAAEGVSNVTCSS